MACIEGPAFSLPKRHGKDILNLAFLGTCRFPRLSGMMRYMYDKESDRLVEYEPGGCPKPKNSKPETRNPELGVRAPLKRPF
jgi:hypothetical protein